MMDILPYGTVRKIWGASEGKPLIVHIQDIHRNAEAQKNISRAVQKLIEQKDTALVALEGAFQPVDLARVRAFPYQNSIQAVADYLLEQNQITGPIYAALTIPSQIPVIGVDDAAHYDANVQAYLTSRASIDTVRATLKRQQRALIDEKSHAFTGALAAFDAKIDAYRANTLPWSDYVQALAHQTSSVPPSLQTFLEALRYERSIDFARCEHERAAVIAALVARLSPEQTVALSEFSLAFKAGRLSSADFYSFLETLCAKHRVDLTRYPAMDAYIRYLLLTNNIDAEQLLNDAAALESSICNTLATTDHQKGLVKKARQLYLTEKLVEFALTREEWEEYKANENRKSRTDQGVINFEAFYREAEARDQKMTENLLKAVKGPVTVLVTGGFHSAGIDRRLAAAGCTVIGWAPKISEVGEERSSAYLSVFAQEKTPLDRLFRGQKLFLAERQAVNLDAVVEFAAGRCYLTRRTSFEEMARVDKKLGTLNIRAGTSDITMTDPDGQRYHEEIEGQRVVRLSVTRSWTKRRVASVALATVSLVVSVGLKSVDGMINGWKIICFFGLPMFGMFLPSAATKNGHAGELSLFRNEFYRKRWVGAVETGAPLLIIFYAVGLLTGTPHLGALWIGIPWFLLASPYGPPQFVVWKHALARSAFTWWRQPKDTWTFAWQRIGTEETYEKHLAARDLGFVAIYLLPFCALLGGVPAFIFNVPWRGMFYFYIGLLMLAHYVNDWIYQAREQHHHSLGHIVDEEPTFSRKLAGMRSWFYWLTFGLVTLGRGELSLEKPFVMPVISTDINYVSSKELKTKIIHRYSNLLPVFYRLQTEASFLPINTTRVERLVTEYSAVVPQLFQVLNETTSGRLPVSQNIARLFWFTNEMSTAIHFSSSHQRLTVDNLRLFFPFRHRVQRLLTRLEAACASNSVENWRFLASELVTTSYYESDRVLMLQAAQRFLDLSWHTDESMTTILAFLQDSERFISQMKSRTPRPAETRPTPEKRPFIDNGHPYLSVSNLGFNPDNVRFINMMSHHAMHSLAVSPQYESGANQARLESVQRQLERTGSSAVVSEQLALVMDYLEMPHQGGVALNKAIDWPISCRLIRALLAPGEVEARDLLKRLWETVAASSPSEADLLIVARQLQAADASQPARLRLLEVFTDAQANALGRSFGKDATRVLRVLSGDVSDRSKSGNFHLRENAWASRAWFAAAILSAGLAFVLPALFEQGSAVRVARIAVALTFLVASYRALLAGRFLRRQGGAAEKMKVRMQNEWEKSAKISDAERLRRHLVPFGLNRVLKIVVDPELGKNGQAEAQIAADGTLRLAEWLALLLTFDDPTPGFYTEKMKVLNIILFNERLRFQMGVSVPTFLQTLAIYFLKPFVFSMVPPISPFDFTALAEFGSTRNGSPKPTLKKKNGDDSFVRAQQERMADLRLQFQRIFWIRFPSEDFNRVYDFISAVQERAWQAVLTPNNEADQKRQELIGATNGLRETLEFLKEHDLFPGLQRQVADGISKFPFRILGLANDQLNGAQPFYEWVGRLKEQLEDVNKLIHEKHGVLKGSTRELKMTEAQLMTAMSMLRKKMSERNFMEAADKLRKMRLFGAAEELTTIFSNHQVHPDPLMPLRLNRIADRLEILWTFVQTDQNSAPTLAVAAQDSKRTVALSKPVSVHTVVAQITLLLKLQQLRKEEAAAPIVDALQSHPPASLGAGDMIPAKPTESDPNNRMPDSHRHQPAIDALERRIQSLRPAASGA